MSGSMITIEPTAIEGEVITRDRSPDFLIQFTKNFEISNIRSNTMIPADETFEGTWPFSPHYFEGAGFEPATSGL